MIYIPFPHSLKHLTHIGYRLHPYSELHVLHLILALPALKAMLKVVVLCHTKYQEHPICSLFYSTFSNSGFTLLFFEAKREALSHNFPDKQGEETVKTECSTPKKYQTHKPCYIPVAALLQRCGNIFPLHLSGPAKSRIPIFQRLEEQP